MHHALHRGGLLAIWAGYTFFFPFASPAAARTRKDFPLGMSNSTPSLRNASLSGFVSAQSSSACASRVGSVMELFKTSFRLWVKFVSVGLLNCENIEF
jgi:hypothetical protein